MFSARRPKQEHDHEALQAQVYQQIGPLKVEWDWVKNTLDVPRHAQRQMIAPDDAQLSGARPCELVG